MKNKVVNITSIFPASKREVFNQLQRFRTLSEVAKPYITFTPIDGDENLKWIEGETFRFQSNLFGLIPFGVHTINVMEFNYDTRIYTNEINTYVPMWNHEITLEKITDDKTRYTDRVELYAGWKTYFVYLWANLFYKHRQKQWIKLLKNKKN